jgi:hypothetical protein
MDDEPTPPAVGWASGPLGAVQAADREIGRQTALRARAVAQFAATRPASADRAPGQPGAMSADRRAVRPEVLADVSEWAAQELVVALSITQKAADDLLSRSLTLVHRLPQTLAALESGALHPSQLWPLLEKVAPVANPRVRTQLERDLLRWMAGRQVTTPAQLGAKIRRELLARDLRSAARELETALRRRGVYARPDRVDGMAELSALMTVPEVEAVLSALGRYADALDDDEGTPRTRNQKMADCLLDLVLRPGETDLSPVQAQLTLVAPIATMAGADAPGEINGQPVPAELVRALARALGLVPDAPQDLPDVDVPPATHVDFVADDHPEALERWWAEVEERALRGEWGGEEDPPPQEMERWWQLESQWSDVGPPGGVTTVGSAATDSAFEAAVDVRDPEASVDGADEEAPPGWWASADRAVDAVAQALLELDRQLARARSVVHRAEIADAADDEARQQSPTARMTAATDVLTALSHASSAQRAALADLLCRTGGGGLVDRPMIAVTDALTGALLALTDARELRARASCGAPACRRPGVACTHDLADSPGLGPPGPDATYRPRVALDRFVRARDRRCRFPGCRRRVPLGGELDHHDPWPDGSTSAGNLTGFCTGHHRGKHQAPGWRYERSTDGTLTITTPTGLTASTSPPPF